MGTGLALAACLALGLLSGCAQTDTDDRPFLPAPSVSDATMAPSPITRDAPAAADDFAPAPAMRSTLAETPAAASPPPALRTTPAQRSSLF
jgi:hypothetical protein